MMLGIMALMMNLVMPDSTLYEVRGYGRNGALLLSVR